MLSSPFIAQYRNATESLYTKLREVDELIELWVNCQSKVGFTESSCTQQGYPIHGLVWASVCRFDFYQSEGKIRLPIVTDFGTFSYHLAAQCPTQHQ